MAQWNGCVVTISGFNPGETDFGSRMARIAVAEAGVLAAFVARLATVADDDTAMVAITTVGCSDRVDDAGLTSEQRRKKEDDAAAARAVSASAWLRDQLKLLRPALAASDPRNWRGIAATKMGIGASNLVAPAPGTDESLRKQNRRVEFRVYAMNLPGFPDRADVELIDIA